MSKSKEYSTDEVTVVWRPDLCIHSGNCVRGLPNVFKPKEKPWIQLDTVNNQELMDQIERCPSGALSYYKNNDSDMKSNETPDQVCKIDLIQNGPLIVHGPIELKGSGDAKQISSAQTALCRCGASSNKPFCDGTHKKVDFEG